MEEKEDKTQEDETENKEPTGDKSGDGDKPKATSLLDKTNETVERLEKANEKREELLDRQEKMLSDKMLGGDSKAGEGTPVKKKLTDEEYAEAYDKGEIDPFKDDGK